MEVKAAPRPRVSWVLFLVLVILHLFLQLTLGYGHSTPDLFVVALLVVARGVNLGVGSLIGLLLGILEDGFSARSFGAHALSFSLLSLVSALNHADNAKGMLPATVQAFVERAA